LLATANNVLIDVSTQLAESGTFKPKHAMERQQLCKVQLTETYVCTEWAKKTVPYTSANYVFQE